MRLVGKAFLASVSVQKGPSSQAWQGIESCAGGLFAASVVRDHDKAA